MRLITWSGERRHCQPALGQPSFPLSGQVSLSQPSLGPMVTRWSHSLPFAQMSHSVRASILGLSSAFPTMDFLPLVHSVHLLPTLKAESICSPLRMTTCPSPGLYSSTCHSVHFLNPLQQTGSPPSVTRVPRDSQSGVTRTALSTSCQSDRRLQPFHQLL